MIDFMRKKINVINLITMSWIPAYLVPFFISEIYLIWLLITGKVISHNDWFYMSVYFCIFIIPMAIIQLILDYSLENI